MEWTTPKAGTVLRYHLERSSDGINFYEKDTFPFNIHEYIDKNVNINKNIYYYRMKVTDSCQNISPYSNIARNILLSADTSGLKPYLNWNTYEYWKQGVLNYQILLHDFVKNKEFYYTEISPLVTSFADVENTNDQPQYCYTIRALRNGDSLESWSNMVCVSTPFRLFIPNAFTPNGDNLNDSLICKGTYILSYNFQIFSRWGEKIFETDQMSKGWDGTYKGQICPSGLYFYNLSAEGTYGQKLNQGGTVMLLR